MQTTKWTTPNNLPFQKSTKDVSVKAEELLLIKVRIPMKLSPILSLYIVHPITLTPNTISIKTKGKILDGQLSQYKSQLSRL